MIYCDFTQTFLFLENAIIATITHIYANNIVFTFKIKLCLYRNVINYLLPPFLWSSYGKQLLSNEMFEKKKDLSLLTNKLIERIPDARNAKDHYHSFIRKKIRKS